MNVLILKPFISFTALSTISKGDLQIASRKTSWIIVFACFVAYAYVVTSIGPVLPVLSGEFALTPDVTGILIGLCSVGGLAAVLGGWASDKASRVLIGVISMVMLALGSLILAVAPNVYAVSSSLILMSISAGFLEAALNAFVSNLYPEKRGLSVNLLHIGWNIGSALGPSLAAVIIVYTGSWRRVYQFALPALILTSILLATLNKKASKSKGEDSPSHISTPISMRLLSRSLPIALIGFFYVGAEMGISTWLAYILQNLGSEVLQAGLSTGLFWGSMGFGRLVWAPATDKIGYARSVTVGSGSALACMIAAASPSPLGVKMILWVLSGFFLAPIFPTLIAWGTSLNPDAGGALSGLIFTFGTLGLLCSDSLIGVVVSLFGVRAAQYLFVFFMSAVVVNVLVVHRLFRQPVQPMRAPQE